MEEFLKKTEGLDTKRPDNGALQEGRKTETDPRTPVFHVEGSKLYHPDAECKTLAMDREEFKNTGINHLFKHLPGKEELALCTDCKKENTIVLPKRIPLDGQD